MVIRKTKEFRKSQYVFKTSIAVSDIIWALVLCCNSAGKNHQYFNTTYTLECHPTLDDKETYVEYEVKHFDCQPRYSYYLSIFDGVYFYFIIFLLMKISLIVSLISLVFAAADRYFAIAFPFKFKKTNTTRVAKVLSIIIWILSVFITVITVFTNVNNFYLSLFLQPTDCESPMQMFESGLLFVLFALLWIFTLLTLKSLYKSYKRSLKLNRVVRNKFLAEKQMSLVLIFMVVAFTFSLSTTLYNHIRFYLCKLNCEDCQDYNVYISLYFLSTNSIWNILVYNLINKKFRSALKALFKKPS